MAVLLEVRCVHCNHVSRLQRMASRAETRQLVCEHCERSISFSITWGQVIAGTSARPQVIAVEAR